MFGYTPEVDDRVVIGKHGKAVRVVQVFPIGKCMTVQGEDGLRMIVDWSDVTLTNNPPTYEFRIWPANVPLAA